MLQRLRSAAVRGCQRQVSRGFKSSTTLRDFQKTKKFPEVIGQQAASGGNFGSFVYQNLMKRSPTYAFVILGAAGQFLLLPFFFVLLSNSSRISRYLCHFS